jgi:hypothetical protein
MLLSPSFMRRYTPPTCTLKIKGKQSLLSNWAGYPILKDLQFELNFDDPRLPEEEKVTIQGDRIDLESLCDVVINYVQNFLKPETNTLPLVADQGISFAFPRSKPQKTRSPSEPILKPKGLLSHELCFKTSNNSETQVIKLSVVQLFDLANALEEYNSEVAAIPNLITTREAKKPIPPWLNIAAGLILGVGITTAWVRVINHTEVTDQLALQESESLSPPEKVPTLEVLPPTPPTPTKPTPTPTLAPSISSSQPLAPPPPVPVAPNIPSSPTLSPQQLPSESSTLTAPYQPILPPPPPPNLGHTGEIPSTSQTPPVMSPPQIPNLPPLQRPALELPIESETESINSAQPSAMATSKPVAGADLPQQTQPTPATTTRNAKATIPQVAEIKTYFQKNWSPPENLTQNLEYRLQLNPDGSLRRIIPVGEDSEVYLDQTNMPLLGQPFVSPLKQDHNPIVRLSLGADGVVSSSLEDETK